MTLRINEEVTTYHPIPILEWRVTFYLILYKVPAETLFHSRRGGNPESFSFPWGPFQVKEVSGTMLVAFKCLAMESPLMQRVMGSLPLPRDGEEHTENEARR